MSSQWPGPGPNHVPAYQISGLPYITGSIISSGDTAVIHFPYATKFVKVFNSGSNPVFVGVTQNGVEGTNKFTVPSSSSSGLLEIRVKDLWLHAGAGNVEAEIIAGLTTIKASDYFEVTGALPPATPTGAGLAHYDGVG